jgi:SOS-response transcriptional repressor LexA
MGIGYRIKEARENQGLTQTELGKIVGVTGSAITNYENETSHPKEPIMYKLIEALKVDANYLFQDCVKLPKEANDVTLAEYEHIKKYRLISTHSPDGASVVDTVLDREYAIAEKLREQKEQLEKVQRMNIEVSEELIPLRLWAYYGKIACAGTGFIFDDIPSDTVQAPDANADFIIGVNGDSMEPDYSDGEKLYIKKVERINPGEVGIFTINNECFLKEYGKDGLVSRNKKYDDIPGNEDVRLIGKVVGKVEE